MTRIRKITSYFHEPAFINLLQTIGYLVAVGCGFLAAMGGIPNIITFQLGNFLAVTVGTMLVVGGVTGALAVYMGIWALERIVIWLLSLGYVALLIPTFAYAVTPGRASTLWLIVGLELQAIIAMMSRYRRIDWAYLDPAK